MQVSFVCQRCSQPLKLDTSFKILDRVTIQELTAPLLTTAQAKPGETQEEEANSGEVKAVPSPHPPPKPNRQLVMHTPAHSLELCSVGASGRWGSY